MKQVNIHEAKTRLSQLIAVLNLGDELRQPRLGLVDVDLLHG